MGEHWGPVEPAWPTPESELEDIELGFRPSWWMLMLDLHHKARHGDPTLTLMSQVAEVTSHRGLTYPDEWLPKEISR